MKIQDGKIENANARTNNTLEKTENVNTRANITLDKIGHEMDELKRAYHAST